MIENMTLTATVFVPAPNVSEIVRYSRSGVGDVQTEALIERCLSALPSRDKATVVYRILPVTVGEDGVDTPFGKISSVALAKVLKGCTRVVLFALTAGIEYDIFINRNEKLSPAAALIGSAIGSERAESIADAFCRYMSQSLAEEGLSLTRRFSPGYSDLSLELQTEIFKILKPERSIGVYLNKSLLMSPSKSVTALMGVISNDLS